MSRFLLALLLALPACAQTTADSARLLARKVLAGLPAGEPVRLTFHNVSGAARLAWEAEASGRPTGPDPALVNLTLAEDEEGYLWVAEIVRGGKRESVAIERAPAPAAEPAPPATAIQKIPLWEQEAPILDLVAAGTDLAVLTPAGVAVWTRQDNGWTLRKTLAIEPPQPWPRDLRGRLSLKGDLLGAFLPGTVCSGALRPEPQLQCQPGEEDWPGEPPHATIPAGKNYFVVPAAQPFFSAAGDSLRTPFEGWGSDIAAIESVCGPGILATKPGEADEPDAIQAFELQNGQPVARGAPVEFRGPVTALWQTSDPAKVLAVTRDLATGRYAAFNLSIACSR